MSQLLLSADEWIQNRIESKTPPKHPQNHPQHNQKHFVKFDNELLRHLLPHREFTQVAIVEIQKCKKYTLVFQNIAKRYKGLLTFNYFRLEGKVSFVFQLLNLNGRLFKLQTSQMLIQFCKCIHLAERCNQLPLKMMVNYDSLQVFFQITYFSHSKSNLVFDLERSMNYTNIVLQIYKKFIQKNLPVIEKALEMVVPVQEKLEQQQQKKLVQNLYRYATMMTMKSNFSVGEIISQQARVKYLQQREASGRNLQMRKFHIEPESIKFFQLYGINKNKKEEKTEKNKNQFYISGPQEKVIKKEITFQLPQGEEEPNKNFVSFLNPINIHQPEKLVMHPLNSGGYSKILFSEVGFWIVESISEKDSQNYDIKNMSRKILAVKKSVRQNGKNLHEIRILRELKVGYKPLLPKYYLPMNVPNYDLDKNPLLMMEMLINGTLDDFLKSRKKSTSLYSKLVLMFTITMGLRFLQKFKIVHLDFKPSNIMMIPGMFIKIIDFGEAYHSEVVKKEGPNYRPGITLPYSAPEVSANKNIQFTSKSDVYSLGVIFYQIIFGKLPFEKRQKFYLAPEQSDKHGDILIVRVLNWMISSCFSRNPDERPELDWISMILKICMYLVI